MPSELIQRNWDETDNILKPFGVITLAKAMQNIVKKKKNVIASKPNVASKNSCICAPTTHPGSFRCHLHRNGAPKKSSLNLSKDNGSKGNTQSINSMNATNTKCNQHQLSRFGRPASAQYQHLK